MRRLVSILTFVLSCLNGFTQQSTDIQIVNKVFQDFNLDRSKYIDTIVILVNPIHNIPQVDSNFERIKDQYRRIERSTYEEFISKLDKDFILQDIKVLATPLIIDKTIYNDYSEVFTKHKNVLIIEISNIGYSDNYDQALLYYGSIQGPMSGGGVYLIYEKRASKWKLKKVIGAWAT
jgi:hypothetical protein